MLEGLPIFIYLVLFFSTNIASHRNSTLLGERSCLIFSIILIPLYTSFQLLYLKVVNLNILKRSDSKVLLGRGLLTNDLSQGRFHQPDHYFWLNLDARVKISILMASQFPSIEKWLIATTWKLPAQYTVSGGTEWHNLMVYIFWRFSQFSIS